MHALCVQQKMKHKKVHTKKLICIWILPCALQGLRSVHAHGCTANGADCHVLVTPSHSIGQTQPSPTRERTTRLPTHILILQTACGASGRRTTRRGTHATPPRPPTHPCNVHTPQGTFTTKTRVLEPTGAEVPRCGGNHSCTHQSAQPHTTCPDGVPRAPVIRARFGNLSCTRTSIPHCAGP